MFSIIKKIALASVLTLIIALLTVPGFRSHLFFLNFVDEDDNMVIGSLVNEGKQVYEGIFSQHQPIPYVLSATVQKVAHPQNILMTVKRHREFMIAWSLAWIFALVLRFGWPLFGTSLVIELVKINLLGSLFLAESLVIYPLLYLVSYVTSVKRYSLSKELLVVIFLIGFIGFTLAPLWPLLGVLLAWIVLKSENKISVTLGAVFVGLVYFLLLFKTGMISHYLSDAILLNYQYYIPLTSNMGTGETIWKAFLAPIYALVSPHASPFVLFLKVLSASFIIQLLWLIKDKKYVKALTLFVILGLASLRYIDPSQTLYGAFHMLPWFVILVLFNFIDFSYHKIRVLLIIIISVSAFAVAKNSLWDKRDLTADYYVHYSPIEDIAKAVSILSKDNPQTLWVEPVAYWPYWHTGVSLYNPMIFYYAWMDQVPSLRDELQGSLARTLPTLVYSEGQSLGIGDYLSEYSVVSRDGSPTNLYIRKDMVMGITGSAKAELSYYRFEIN